VRKDPRGYYLIDGAKEAMCRDRQRNIGAEDSCLLAFAQDAFDYVKVFHQEIVGKLAEKLRTVSQLGLKNNRQAAVGPQGFQVEEGHAPQLFPRIGYLVQRSPGPLNKAVEGRIDGCHQQLILILEVQIDGAVSYAGPVGDLGHAGMKEAMLGDDFDRGIEDSLVLV